MSNPVLALFQDRRGRRRRSNLTPDFSGALILILLLAILMSGCGSATPTATQGTPSPTSRARITASATLPSPTITPTPESQNRLNVNPAALQGSTIEFWHPWSGATGETIDALVQEYNQTNTYGITVEQVYQGNYNDLYASVDQAIQAGVTPALTVAYNYQILNWQAQSNEILDLNPYVSDPEWGLSQTDQADFYPVFWEQDVIDGIRIGFPGLRSAQLLYYNTTWAKELGFDGPPDTPAAFKEQACAASSANSSDSDPENNGTGGWAVDTSPSGILSWLYAFGSDPVSPGGTYQFDTREARSALAFLKDLYDSGCAWITESDIPVAEFASRQALFATGSLADLDFQRQAFDRAGNQDEWAAIPFPAPQGEPVIDVYGPSFTLLRSSQVDQLAAWLFVRWLAGPEQQARMVQASGTYPIWAAGLDYLGDYTRTHPQWSRALALLPYAKAEPALRSWSTVRWVVGDVGTQIFRSYFTPDRIPATLELMDSTAAELHDQAP